MKYAVLLAAAALGATGCAAEPVDGPSTGISSPPTQTPQQVTDQKEFDLTFAFDREQFTAIDLNYRESVGPYAVFEITGAAPRLVGPEVLYPTELGTTAMLCAASNYFSPDGSTLIGKLSLVDGFTDEVFIDATVRSAEFDECAPPSDDYGEKIPNDDPGGGDDMVPRSGRLDIDVGGGLPINSLILMRRVAFGIQPDGHNGSHVIPAICCNTELCGLGDAQEPPK